MCAPSFGCVMSWRPAASCPHTRMSTFLEQAPGHIAFSCAFHRDKGQRFVNATTTVHAQHFSGIFSGLFVFHVLILVTSGLEYRLQTPALSNHIFTLFSHDRELDMCVYFWTFRVNRLYVVLGPSGFKYNLLLRAISRQRLNSSTKKAHSSKLQCAEIPHSNTKTPQILCNVHHQLNEDTHNTLKPDVMEAMIKRWNGTFFPRRTATWKVRNTSISIG